MKKVQIAEHYRWRLRRKHLTRTAVREDVYPEKRPSQHDCIGTSPCFKIANYLIFFSSNDSRICDNLHTNIKLNFMIRIFAVLKGFDIFFTNKQTHKKQNRSNIYKEYFLVNFNT